MASFLPPRGQSDGDGGGSQPLCRRRMAQILAGLPSSSRRPTVALGSTHAASSSSAPVAAPITLPLNTVHNTLGSVGGKGRSLSTLARAGHRVPGGFLVTTEGYRSFVRGVPGLRARILGLAARPEVERGRASFGRPARAIAELFAAHAGELPARVAAAISAAHGEVAAEVAAGAGGEGAAAGPGLPAFAVRSSATAEDLPGMSFAGQHSSFLNVRGGAEGLCAKVVACWASLWTAQAMSYRHEHGVEQSSVAMAVVCQLMIPSRTAGIVFTANPATGVRQQMVINASWGLGEAVVSGQVTPDTWLIAKDTQRVTQATLGPKQRQIISAPPIARGGGASSQQAEEGAMLLPGGGGGGGGGGVVEVEVEEARRGEACLTAAMLQELIRTAVEVERLYGGVPQDIEWGYDAAGTLHLLQVRAAYWRAVHALP
jgi:phosphoenolpyruvate synthase/pyruvate phosphate dikinase